MKYVPAALLTTALLVGCSTSQKMSDVQVGMTKQEVIKVVGTPVSASAQGGTELLRFTLSNGFTGNPWYQNYYVRLINGKVESYGHE